MRGLGQTVNLGVCVYVMWILMSNLGWLWRILDITLILNVQGGGGSDW